MQFTTEETQNTKQNQREGVHELIMSMMGVDKLAYIKPASSYGFTVFAADGSELADFDTQEEAFDAILRHNLTPARLH